MNRLLLLLLLLVLALPACAGLEAPPRAADEVALDEEVAAAVRLEVQGRTLEARRILEGVLARAPDHVPAHRLLQNIRIAARERNALLREYEAFLAADPRRAERHYLLGRLRHRFADQKAAFEEARRLDPRCHWAHHGLAWAALLDGDLAAARGHAEEAIAIAPGEVSARLLLARLLLLRQSASEARELLTRLLAEHPDEADAWTLLAGAAAQSGDRDQELAARTRALALDPGSVEDRDRLLAMVEAGSDSPSGRLARYALEGIRSAPAAGDEGDRLLAEARLERVSGRPEAARALAERAFALGRRDPLLREILEEGPDWLDRRLAWYGLAESDLPPRLVALRALLRESPRGPAAAAALLAAGFSDRAEAALAGAEDEAPELAALIRSHRRIEARIALLAEHAGEERSGELGRDLEVFLARVASVIEEETGQEAHQGNRILAIPFVGSALDSSLALAGSINGYLRRSNQILYAGRLAGGRVQVLLFTMLGGPVEVSPPGWRQKRPCQEVTGLLAVTRPRDELFGDSGGRALFGGYYLDLDVLVPWQARMAEVTRLPAEERARILADEGLPARNDQELRDIDRPGEADDALFLRAFAIHGELPFLEHVRAHEQGHLLDSQRYLPIGGNLLGNLILLIESGFSSEGVMAGLEGSAELHALRAGPSPHLVLGEMVRSLPRTQAAGPHARGYREILRAFVAEAARRIDEFPALRRDRVLLHQLHRLGEDEIRAIAAGL